MMYSTHFFVLCFAVIISSTVNASCFHSNGSATTAPYHQPCSNDTSNPLSSICCAIGRPYKSGTYASDGSYVADVCLDNGLCENYSRNGDGVFATTYWREECTFADWKKGSCLDICEGSANGGNVQMIPCDGTPTSEKWCCGMSDSCCNTSGAIILAKQFSGNGTASTSLVASASIPTSTSVAQNTTSPTPKAQSSTQLSAGDKAGIAIGTIAGVCAIFAAGYFIARSAAARATAKQNPVVEKGTESDKHYTPHGMEARPYMLANSELQELSAHSLVEAPDNEKRWKNQELP